MRLQISILGALVAAAIVAVLVRGAGSDDTLTAGRATRSPGGPTVTLPDATISRPLPAPEWVAGTDSSIMEFYLSSSVLDVAAGDVWHVTAPGRRPVGSDSPIAVDFLAWTPNAEALVGVAAGGRTALSIGRPGGELRAWTTIQGEDLWRTHISWSPDGALVAIGDLILDAESGDVVMELRPGARLGWSPDGRYFAVLQAPEDGSGILVWDRESEGMTEVRFASDAVMSTSRSNVAYTPAGDEATQVRTNQILVHALDDAPTADDMLLAEIEGLSATLLAWSPSGDHLLVQVQAQPHPEGGVRLPELHVIEVESGDTVSIIESASYPIWAPERDQLVINGDICGDFDIFTVEADGRGLTNHTNSSDLDLWPRWSPSGGRVAYVSYREDSVGLFLLEPGAGTNRPLISFPRDELSPGSWSPDGRFLTFRYGGGRGLCEAPVEPTVTTVRLPT